MAFPAVMNVAAMKRAIAVMCFMTDLLLRLLIRALCGSGVRSLQELVVTPGYIACPWPNSSELRPRNRIRVFAMTYSGSIDSQWSNPLPRAVPALSDQIPREYPFGSRHA